MLSSSLGKVCQVQFEWHTVLGAIKDFSGPSEIKIGLEFNVWRDSSEKLLEMKLPVVSCGRALSSLVLNTLTKAIHEAVFLKTIHTSPLRYIREGTQSWNLEAETETRAREQMFSTCGVDPFRGWTTHWQESSKTIGRHRYLHYDSQQSQNYSYKVAEKITSWVGVPTTQGTV